MQIARAGIDDDGAWGFIRLKRDGLAAVLGGQLFQRDSGNAERAVFARDISRIIGFTDRRCGKARTICGRVRHAGGQTAAKYQCQKCFEPAPYH